MKILLSYFIVPLFTTLYLLLPTVVFAADYFVSPGGSSLGDGSINNPWDLQTALHGGNGKIIPGDTLNLRGGTYNQSIYYHSSLAGSASNYIKVQSYPGEWAIVDRASAAMMPANTEGFFEIEGSYTIYRGFEVTNSSPLLGCAAPDCSFNRVTGVVPGAPGHNNKIVNLVIHDNGIGMFFANGHNDSEVYGNIFYNNGASNLQHGIYAQNANSTKYITNNMILNSYAYGFHAYASGSYLNYFNLAGNTIFKSGSLGGSNKANILIGGNQPDLAEWPIIKDNYLYYSGSSGTGINLGYSTGCHHPQVGPGNYIARGSSLITFVNCSDITVTGNTFYGSVSSLQSTYPNNTYYSARPTTNSIFVRPNKYEQGRANITVFNWANVSSVDVDVSNILQIGDSYEVKDVQDYLGPAIASGTYRGGSITIPMTGTAVAQPTVPTLSVTHTSSEFGAFVLKRTGTPIYLEPPDDYGPDTIPPSVPRSFKAGLANSNLVNLSWIGSYDNTGSNGPTGYKIYRNGAALKTLGQICTTNNNCSYSDLSILPQTSYIYTVSATDDAGNESAQSAPSTVTTGGIPGDYNLDGKVDINDMLTVVNSFNNPYTIFDLTKVIANYGK